MPLHFFIVWHTFILFPNLFTINFLIIQVFFCNPFGGVCFFISWLLILIFAMGKIFASGNKSSQYRK